MKIVIVNKFYAPWIGGIETVVRQLSDYFAERQNETTVICCAPKRGMFVDERMGAVRVIRARIWGVFLKMPVSIDFFRWFKREAMQADCINLHHPFPLGFFAYWWYRPSAPLIVHYHADIFRQKISGWLIRPLLKAVLRQAHTIVVSNQAMIQSSPVLKKFAGKCAVIPFGIDIQEVDTLVDPAEAQRLRHLYGDYILFVGRLSYYKGIEFLIEAARGLPHKLIIVGEGAAEPALRALITQYHMGEQVIIVPPQPYAELVTLFKAARVFVLPSIAKAEAFGMVLLQAMACGVPVISTELGTGTSFVNQHGVTGLVVPPRDSVALAAALSSILSDQSLQTRFGAHARERVVGQFSLDQFTARTYRLFEEVSTTTKNTYA